MQPVFVAGAQSSVERTTSPRNALLESPDQQQTPPETPHSSATDEGTLNKEERRPTLFIAIPAHTQRQQRRAASSARADSPNVFQFPDSRAGGPVSPPPSLGSSLPAQSVLLRTAAASLVGGTDDIPLLALSPRAVSVPKGAAVSNSSPSNSRPVSTTSVELEVRTILLIDFVISFSSTFNFV